MKSTSFVLQAARGYFFVPLLLVGATLSSVASGLGPDHSQLPGVVINYSPASSGKYIGCPSIAILPDGQYVASHTFFGPKASLQRTLVFSSADRGATWAKRSEIDGQFWSGLFVHRGALYIMGPNRQWGSVVIRRSRDGGRTWTEPADKNSGLLLDDGRYHSSTVPVIEHNARLWRAMEAEDSYPQRGRDVHPYRALVMSAAVDADLLRADSWTPTNYQKFDLRRVGKRPGQGSGGWREGNVVVAPGGQLLDFLRIDDAGVDRADLLAVSADGRQIRIDDAHWGLIDFPGGRTKFTIRLDPNSQRYWSLVNKQSDPPAERNVLALVSSADLKRWTVNTIVLRHRDRRHHAWQYVDWQFDGNDIVAASRTGWDDSNSFHDANYLTFHRIEKFREMTMEDACPWLGSPRPTEWETADFIARHPGLELALLKDGVRAFGNRPYVWRKVPEELDGWRFLRTCGGKRSEISVRAKRDLVLRVGAAPSQAGFRMPGWRPVEGLSWIYTSARRTPMMVFEKEVSKGQEIAIPQTSWAGSLLLFGPDNTR